MRALVESLAWRLLKLDVSHAARDIRRYRRTARRAGIPAYYWQ